MKLLYSDQNNNVYVVTSSELSYDPVTELESSSGTYSGGEPYKVSIKASEYEEIVRLAREIAGSPEGKSDKREMLTSVLTLVDDQKESAFILKRSEIRTKLETMLKEYGN